MGLTSMERQAQKRLDDARKRAETKKQNEISSSAPSISDPGRKTLDLDIGTSISSERDSSGSTITKEFDPKTGQTTTSVRKSQQQIQAEALAAQEALQQKFLQAQTQQQIAGLRGARGGSLAALEQQRGRVEPAFLSQRTGLRTQAKQAGRQTEATLAAKGLARSGASTQSDIARNIALQQGLTESGQQEAGALANIAAGEADVERQFQTGVAQAEAGAASQQAQFEIEQIRQQQAQAVQTEQLEANRRFQLQQQQQADAVDQQLRAADLAIEEARRTQDFEREDQLLRLKSDLDQESIRLRAQLTPTRSSGGSGGTTDKTLLSDAGKGLSIILKQTAGQPVSVQQNRILDYAASLRDSGYPDSVIEQLLVQAGITGGVTTGGDTSILGGIRQ